MSQNATRCDIRGHFDQDRRSKALHIAACLLSALLGRSWRLLGRGGRKVRIMDLRDLAMVLGDCSFRKLDHNQSEGHRLGQATPERLTC
jgi:hypothetical protein